MIYPWEIDVQVAEEVISESPTLRALMEQKAREVVGKRPCDPKDPADRKDGSDPEAA